MQSALQVYGERCEQRDKVMRAAEMRQPGNIEDNDAAVVARTLLAARRRYNAHFPKMVFKDSAWDMVLELFVAEHEQRPVCVKQLMAATQESCTAALRRIDQLEETGILDRSPDPRDHRRVLVNLTGHGRLAMTELLRDLGQTRIR